jgi:hypothetical protein
MEKTAVTSQPQFAGLYSRGSPISMEGSIQPAATVSPKKKKAFDNPKLVLYTITLTGRESRCLNHGELIRASTIASHGQEVRY